MKVLMLTFTHDDHVDAWNAMSAAEQDEFRRVHTDWFDRNGGLLTGGTELAYPQTAATITLVDGEVVISDGPFAETKELLGGIIELEVESFEQARRVASEWPNLQKAGNRVVVAVAGGAGVAEAGSA